MKVFMNVFNAVALCVSIDLMMGCGLSNAVKGGGIGP